MVIQNKLRWGQEERARIAENELINMSVQEAKVNRFGGHWQLRPAKHSSCVCSAKALSPRHHIPQAGSPPPTHAPPYLPPHTSMQRLQASTLGSPHERLAVKIRNLKTPLATQCTWLKHNAKGHWPIKKQHTFASSYTGFNWAGFLYV